MNSSTSQLIVRLCSQRKIRFCFLKNQLNTRITMKRRWRWSREVQLYSLHPLHQTSEQIWEKISWVWFRLNCSKDNLAFKSVVKIYLNILKAEDLFLLKMCIYPHLLLTFIIITSFVSVLSTRSCFSVVELFVFIRLTNLKTPFQSKSIWRIKEITSGCSLISADEQYVSFKQLKQAWWWHFILKGLLL